uniref:Uncharacterized protein n=1 Tax=Caenorhabditis japonica TaxID=281687 RepID=A0A8R1DFJ4_CAEJA
MKFATVRFIRSPSNSNELSRDADLEKFMKDLLKLNDSDSESIGLMRRTTWRLVEKDDWEENITELELKRTFARVFISRCLVDVLFELSKGRLDAVTLRDRALMFFTPDIPNFTQHLEEFCDAYFWNGQQISKCAEKCEEVILNNVFHLLNVSVKHGNDDTGKREYMSTLKKLLADSRLNFSSEIVVTMLSTILDLCKNKKEKEVECEWICETANKLLLTGNNGELLENEENLEILMKEGVVLDRMYLRSATMLIATCSHEDILTPSTAMSSLFKALIPALLGNLNDTIQKVGLELIGYASSIDFENCNPYLKLTRFLILRDDPLLKATGLRTLIKVIKSNGFPQTAEAIFYEGGENKNAQEYQESLAKLVEKTVILFQGEALGQAVLDCFSMLSVGDYAWPRLVSALLILVFSKNNEHLQLKKIFNIFCKKSVRSLWSKIHLLIGFYRAINVISSIPESEANCDLLEMTASICECVGRVQTVGEEENNQEGELHAEIELASRMIRRAVSRPSSWWIQHIFTSLATSLRLECVPMKDLERVHEELVDSYTEIRFNSGKLAQIAVKRFITHCEKTMILQARMNGLEIPYDLKKVKKEEKDGDGARASTSSISTGSKKRKRGRKCSEENQSVWDDDSFEEKCNSDDSFELQYFPRSTRTRVRKDTPTSFVSDNVPEETNIADDSFEL